MKSNMEPFPELEKNYYLSNQARSREPTQSDEKEDYRCSLGNTILGGDI